MIKSFGVIAVIITLGLYAVPSHAGADAYLPEAQKSTEFSSYNNTHPPLNLTPDKSEIITLNDDAASIIVGNSKHLNIMTDSARRLIVIPRTPGASHFTVLGHDGTTLMQRYVIVGSPQKDYLRIRRNCTGAGKDCAPTSVYYCPDGCHKVAISDDSAETANHGDIPANAAFGFGYAPADYAVPSGSSPIPPNATPE